MKTTFNILTINRHFTRVLAALTVSGLGTAFTSVAVYQKLTETNWGATGFGLAFAAGLLPGMATSLISGRYSKNWPIGKILILGQIIGMLALILPLWGSIHHQVGWLLMAEVISSAVGGLLLPVYKGLERSSFTEEQFPTLASLDTFLLTANFICGQGLGSLLISYFTLPQFLMIDAFSYLIALVLLWPLARSLGPIANSDSTPGPTLKFSTLMSDQKRALLILIWLPIVTVPLMVVLPARGGEFGTATQIFGLIGLTPALFIICGRTLGQILGPLAAIKLNLAKLSEKSWSLTVALLLYVVSYSLAFVAPSIYMTVALCMFAHIASNVVYAVGSYQLLKQFSAQDIGWASGFLYCAATLVMGVIGISAGVLASRWGYESIIAFSTLTWIAGGIFWRSNGVQS